MLPFEETGLKSGDPWEDWVWGFALEVRIGHAGEFGGKWSEPSPEFHLRA
jgi:hypothetical protein